MSEPLQEGRFEPLHDAHAIEQVAIGLHFSAPLDDERMRAAVRTILDRFKAELPGGGDLQTLTLAVGQFPAGAFAGSRQAAGRVFNRVRPDGTLDSELRVESASVTFRTTAYTRWANVSADAMKYMVALQSMYLAKASIAGFSLSFVDKFYWVGEDLSKFRADALLRVGSRYVCPHVYDSTDLWHSYTGAFLRPAPATKRLLNVNVDCLDQQEQVDGTVRRYVQVTTSLTDMLNQPGYTATPPVAVNDAASVVAAAFDDLHSFSKDVFANIISDKMGQRIALIE